MPHYHMTYIGQHPKGPYVITYPTTIWPDIPSVSAFLTNIRRRKSIFTRNSDTGKLTAHKLKAEDFKTSECSKDCKGTAFVDVTRTRR